MRDVGTQMCGNTGFEVLADDRLAANSPAEEEGAAPTAGTPAEEGAVPEAPCPAGGGDAEALEWKGGATRARGGAWSLIVRLRLVPCQEPPQ